MGLEKDRNGIGWVKIYLGMRRKLKWERERVGWRTLVGSVLIDIVLRLQKQKKYKKL